jgi:hypothetical protein
MSVRRVANGGIGAVVPVTVPVSDSYELRHVQSPFDSRSRSATAAIGEANLEASANCICAIAAKKGAVALYSWVSEESQIESREYQDNANVHHQPFPESVSEERDIQTDYDGHHYHEVKRDSDLSAHFSLHGLYCK